MNMIEVDPKLFIKCRLCLDETGQYQIVPNVQMQIKYCFDIDVEPFDGLPQLICKKCESILSQYAGIKQIFQEKQKNLKSKLNSNVKIDNIIQQQQDTVSSTQAETENKNKVEEATRNNRKTPVPKRSSSTETVITNLSHKRNRKTVLGKKSVKAWESKYTKYFGCRFCPKLFKEKKAINNHIQKQCKLYMKYSKINKPFCLVALNRKGSEPNLTGSIENVVCDENRIIQSRQPNYYILYTNNSNDRFDLSDSSDEDFVFDRKKRKRQRLISRSSNETVVIDQNFEKRTDCEKFAKTRKPRKDNNTQILSDIECVDIEDSDSNSTKSSVKTNESVTPHREQTKTSNDEMINNIIIMCSNKYLNRLNASEAGNTNKGREESSLKHKILSIGRKVIHGKGVNTTGLLRYMEHKNLEVVWVPKIDTKVTIKTRSRESGDINKNKQGWENITSVHKYITEDFALVFEKELAQDACINENRKDSQLTQLDPRETRVCQENSNEKEKQASTSLNFSDLTELDIQSVGNSSNNDNVPDKLPTCVDTSEGKSNDNNSHLRAVLDADRNWTKLLNANPVANPKQLPKKNTSNEPASIVKIYSNDSEVIEHSEQHIEKNDDLLHMPIIASTVSLAPPANVVEQPNVAYNNQKASENNSLTSRPQSTLPKIKVKPVSELMSNEALSQRNPSSFVSTTGWTVNNESQGQNVVLQANDSNMVYLTNPQFASVVPVQKDLVYYPQTQDVQTVGFNSSINQPGSKPVPKNREYVRLNTVELPNTRTDAPFRYFQKLLQMHNLVLLDSIHAILNKMQCLTKFKVVFEQESNSPVKLCLLLYCQNNIFCIKANDHNMKELDIAKFSANWQWEILKVFKGDDVVPKLLASASRFGVPMCNYTSYFTNLLRSIEFSKDS
ncbi:uncharacterized protein LOC123864457 [Maniola jurtina]|uniref:uncharacterized protein LOC123864457 n=1 Tax=Maniola jurtina TaxID=191418 RepID=UPI001E6884BB|nr:uncharacterized protein LOC123864457 [Maniola jurtina]XP_045760863.1 uncharacterized protein LOC123864457 [Maniola jurtina]